MTRFVRLQFLFPLSSLLIFIGTVSASAWVDPAAEKASPTTVQADLAAKNQAQKSSEPDFISLDAITPQQREQLKTALDGITANRQKLDEVRCHYRITLGPIGPEESKFFAPYAALEPIQASTSPSNTTSQNKKESTSNASPVVHEGVWLHSAVRQATRLTLRCDPSVIETNRRARNAWVSVFFDDPALSSDTDASLATPQKTETGHQETESEAEIRPNAASSFADYRPCYDEQFLRYKSSVLTYSELINTGNLYTNSSLSPQISGTPFDARAMGMDEQESPAAYLRQILGDSPMPQLGKIQIKIDSELEFNGLTGWRLTILCDQMRWECTLIPERGWLPIRIVQQPSNATSEIPLTAAVMEVVEFGQTDALWYPKRLISIDSKPQDVPLLAAWYEVESLAYGEAAAITDAKFGDDFSLSLPVGAKIVHFNAEENTPTWTTLSSDMGAANSSTDMKITNSTDLPPACRISADSLSTLVEQIRAHGHPVSSMPQISESSSNEESKQGEIQEELRQLVEKPTAEMDPNAVKRRIYGSFLDDPKNHVTVIFCTVCTILIIVGVRMIIRRRAMKRKSGDDAISK